MSKKGRHKTVDKELKKSIKWLESLDVVEKLCLGISEAARHAYTPGHLRFQMRVDGGCKLKAYGGRGVIDLFVKVSPQNVDVFLKMLSTRYPS